MKKFSMSFAFSRSLSGISRTLVMSLATLLLFTCFLLVLGSYGLFHFNVNENLSQLSTVGQAAAFLESDCTENEMQQVRALLDRYQQEGILREYRYISGADALRSELEKFRDYPQLYQSLQTGENPYRASFIVTATGQETLETVIAGLRGVTLTRTGENGEITPYVPVATITSHQGAAEKVESIMNTIQNGVLILLLVLLFISLFVLINTIRLAIFSQRKELAIMRYVGATHGVLTAPFLLHGVVLGFLSAVVSFFLQWMFYQKLSAYFAEHYQMISLLPFDAVWYYLLAAFLFVGLFVGLIGGLLSSGRYLQERG